MGLIILHYRWNETIPEELKKLNQRCWSADFEERPNFGEICDVLEKQMNLLPKGAEDSGGGGGGSDGCCSVM